MTPGLHFDLHQHHEHNHYSESIFGKSISLNNKVWVMDCVRWTVYPNLRKHHLDETVHPTIDYMKTGVSTIITMAPPIIVT